MLGPSFKSKSGLAISVLAKVASNAVAHLVLCVQVVLKFMFSKKATKNDQIFTIDLTFTRFSQFLWPS